MLLYSQPKVYATFSLGVLDEWFWLLHSFPISSEQPPNHQKSDCHIVAFATKLSFSYSSHSVFRDKESNTVIRW